MLFALGKAYDDIGDPARAAGYFREGNRLVAGMVDWSRKNFRRMVAARLDAKPLAEQLADTSDFVPIFIVGMPRSGSDARCRSSVAPSTACAIAASSTGLRFSRSNWSRARGRSTAPVGKRGGDISTQVRQDDAPARFYIDKQPLNFLHIDLIATLFPNARIIHCERNERDTAFRSGCSTSPAPSRISPTISPTSQR